MTTLRDIHGLGCLVGLFVALLTLAQAGPFAGSAEATGHGAPVALAFSYHAAPEALRPAGDLPAPSFLPASAIVTFALYERTAQKDLRPSNTSRLSFGSILVASGLGAPPSSRGESRFAAGSDDRSSLGLLHCVFRC